uniref:Putative salivary lipocalin n=1 Tax=Ixodes ricinus TaxID=34613 RepID=A0A6B0VAI6_IXORI
MPGRLYFGGCSLLISCLNVFVVTTAAPTNIDVDLQSRQQTSDSDFEILRKLHGTTFSLSPSSLHKTHLVKSDVSCFTMQLLYSADEIDHKVMLWLHYEETGSRLKRVDTITFAVNPETNKLENKLLLDFDGSSNTDLAVKEAEFVSGPPSCTGLKILLNDRVCVFLALPTSSAQSGSNNCLSKERPDCNYEAYEPSTSGKCLQYVSVVDTHQSGSTEVTTPTPDDNKPLLETDGQLQEYQDFKRGLLFSSLVLVYSSYGDDPFRLCMITYHPNEEPKPDGNLYILTSGLTGDQAMVQAFKPYTIKGHDDKFKTAARINRNGEFHESRVIFTDRRQCILLRTPGYHNLCELFTGGRYTNGILNNICFFIYTVYCKQPEKRFTKLGDCWPPANKRK